MNRIAKLCTSKWAHYYCYTIYCSEKFATSRQKVHAWLQNRDDIFALKV